MIRYFISDLHINNSDHMSELFIDFLSKINDCDELYIIGDLFEVWLGDDLEIPKYSQVIAALKKASLGKKIYFIAGNRDFLIGEDFFTQSNITQLPDPYIFKNNEQTICLTHGDIFCTLDKKYQFFRKIVRNKLIKNLFLSLPCYLRRKIGNFIRRKSQAFKDHLPKTNNFDLKKFDINPKALLPFIAQNNIDIVIHGHTHKALIENYAPLKCTRYVLAEWKPHSGLIIKMDKSSSKEPFHIDYQQITKL